MAEKAEGNRLFEDGEFAQAAAAFTAALRLVEHGSSLQASLFSNRSAAYLRWGQPELAAADAQACLVVTPGDVKPYYRLGQAFEAMGQHEHAAYACGEWVQRACSGALTERQHAQLDQLRARALARLGAAPAAASCAMSTRLSVRSQRRSPRSAASTASTEVHTFEVLTVGDGGIFLQTLANVLRIRRARLKVVCNGRLLKDADAAEVVRMAAARTGAKPLVLHALGEPSDDESDVDARSVELVGRQLAINRREAISRLRATKGDVLDALLM